MYICEQPLYCFEYLGDNKDTIPKLISLYPGKQLHCNADKENIYIFEGVETTNIEKMVLFRIPETQQYGCMSLGYFYKYLVCGESCEYEYNEINCFDSSQPILIQDNIKFIIGESCLLTDHQKGIIDEPMFIGNIMKNDKGNYDIIFEWLVYNRVSLRYTDVNGFIPYVHLKSVDE